MTDTHWAEQMLWHQYADLTVEADRLGVDWQKLPVDTFGHLVMAIRTLTAANSCKRQGRRHWLLGP